MFLILSLEGKNTMNATYFNSAASQWTFQVWWGLFYDIRENILYWIVDFVNYSSFQNLYAPTKFLGHVDTSCKNVSCVHCYRVHMSLVFLVTFSSFPGPNYWYPEHRQKVIGLMLSVGSLLSSYRLNFQRHKVLYKLLPKNKNQKKLFPGAI